MLDPTVPFAATDYPIASGARRSKAPAPLTAGTPAARPPDPDSDLLWRPTPTTGSNRADVTEPRAHMRPGIADNHQCFGVRRRARNILPHPVAPAPRLDPRPPSDRLPERPLEPKLRRCYTALSLPTRPAFAPGQHE